MVAQLEDAVAGLQSVLLYASLPRPHCRRTRCLGGRQAALKNVVKPLRYALVVDASEVAFARIATSGRVPPGSILG